MLYLDWTELVFSSLGSLLFRKQVRCFFRIGGTLFTMGYNFIFGDTKSFCDVTRPGKRSYVLTMRILWTMVLPAFWVPIKKQGCIITGRRKQANVS